MSTTTGGRFDLIEVPPNEVIGPLQEFQQEVEDATVPVALSGNVGNTTNVLATIGDFTRPVRAGVVYVFRIILRIADANGEGIRLDLDGGTAPMDWMWATYVGFDNALSIAQQVEALDTVVDSDGFTGKIQIDGAFEPSDDGTFAPRFSQKAHSVGNVTVSRGSSVLVQEAVVVT
jgi:hypothetical protein